MVTEERNYGSPISRDSEGPWKHFDRLLAESFIPGRELTVAVLGDRPLAVTELKPARGFYDYDAKYTDGLTTHVCPAQVPADVAQAAMDMALAAHQALGCKGRSRSDFRWDDSKGVEGLYFLAVYRSEEHTAEIQSLMRISYAVFCLKKKTITHTTRNITLSADRTYYHTPY